MKKLMIAAAIVCAAALSQAATVSWQVTGLQDSTGATLNGGYAYVFNNKSGTYKSVTALTTALEAITSADDFKTFLSTSGYSTGLSGAVNSGKESVDGVKLSQSGLAASKTNTQLFALITDSAEITDDTKWYVTALSNKQTTGASDDASGSAAFSVADTGSHTSENWKPVGDVPEPTSAMLVLLGVAGLALRRRA